MLARQLSQSYVCRCVPTLPTQLAEDLYGAASSYVDKAETQLTSLSSSLNNNEQRLRRYISDINRGKWIIIASGKPSNLSQWLLTSVLSKTSVLCFSCYNESEVASVFVSDMHAVCSRAFMYACLHQAPKCMRQPVSACLHAVLYPVNTWAAQYYTWLLVELMPKGVKLSCLFPLHPVNICQSANPAVLINLCDLGLGAGLVLSLIWMLVLRLFCGVMVWVTIWMANLCFIACTIFSYAKAGDVSATSKLGHVSHARRLHSKAQSQATCKQFCFMLSCHALRRHPRAQSQATHKPCNFILSCSTLSSL